jgi:glycosyltransferase involved in cell wall biosynthesis
MLGRIPKASVPRFLHHMDALTIPWRHNPLYRFGVSPNKVFEYMLAGRPIVQACGASNDLIAEADCGITVAPEDTDAFATAISRLRALSPEERGRLGENGRRYVVERHDSRILAGRLLDGASTDDRHGG